MGTLHLLLCRIKGDYHHILNNTLFDASGIDFFDPTTSYWTEDPLDSLDGKGLNPLIDLTNDWEGENKHTELRRNAADSMSDEGGEGRWAEHCICIHVHSSFVNSSRVH